MTAGFSDLSGDNAAFSSSPRAPPSSSTMLTVWQWWCFVNWFANACISAVLLWLQDFSHTERSSFNFFVVLLSSLASLPAEWSLSLVSTSLARNRRQLGTIPRKTSTASASPLITCHTRTLLYSYIDIYSYITTTTCAPPCEIYLLTFVAPRERGAASLTLWLLPLQHSGARTLSLHQIRSTCFSSTTGNRLPFDGL